MAANTVLCRHTKKIKEVGQGHIRVVPKGKGRKLKMIHHENNVLTDNELVIVRDFLKMSKHACLYVRNEHPRGFKVLNHV